MFGEWTGVGRRRPARRRRNARLILRAEWLEDRTLLSVPGPVGSSSPVPTATGSDLQAFNLQLRPGSGQALSQLTSLIADDGATVAPTSVSGLYVVRAPGAIMAQLAAEFLSNPAVAGAAPVHEFQVQTVPNDPNYSNGNQWQLNGTWGVNAPAAWSATTGTDQVIVADVDSGLAYNLKDIYDNVWLNQAEIPANVVGNLSDLNGDGLITFNDLNSSVDQGAGKIIDTNSDGIISGADVLASTGSGGWRNTGAPNTQDGDTASPNDFIGWNFVTGTNDPADPEGHGTFTAGEIGELTNNSLGGAGLVWNTQIMPVAFLDSTGNGTDTAAAEAIEYAVDHGARVINASWGANGEDSIIESAIQYADAHNVIIVCAAGNNGTDDDTTFFSPASYSATYANVISVAAIGSNGARASFSDFGVGAVQLAAPGVNVYSTLSSGNFGTMSGTSMAAPMVTGAVALIEAAHPGWSMSQVIDAVVDTVTPDPALAGVVTTGGVLNVGAAVANTDGPYVVSGAPDGSINTSGGFSTVQVTFNEEINPATFSASKVSLTGPGGAIPAAGITITPVSGSSDHEFQISFPSQSAAGSYRLTVGPGIEDWYGNDMNQNRNGTNGEAADAFTETIRLTAPGSTDVLSVTGIPMVTPAGISETFTVTALSPGGGTDTGYAGTVHFTSTDPQAGLPANFIFTAANHGTRSFAVTFKTAGSQAITATDTAIQAIVGTEENFIVSPGAAKTLRVAGFPMSDVAGTPQTFTVTALDIFGNVATGYVGTVTFSSTDSAAVLPPATTIVPEDQGSLSFTATLKTVGMQSITAKDTTSSSITGSEPNINVQAVPPKSLVVSGFPTTKTAGTAGNVTVTARNADGTVATSYTGTVIFSSTDPNAQLPAPYTFTGADAGTHAFSITLETAGSQSITVTDSSTSSLSGSETGITVSPAAPAMLAISGFPGNPIAGTAHSFTISVVDAYNNQVTGYLGTVDLSSSDSSAQFSPAIYTFDAADAGTHLFSGTLESAGTQSITATDTTSDLSGTETGITVQPAAAHSFMVSNFPANAVAGTSYNVTVTAYDAYNNVATGYTGTVNLTSTDPSAIFSPPSFTFTAASAGTRSFSVTLKSAGPQSINASDATNDLTGTEAAITVQPAAAHSFAVSSFPANATAGIAYTVTVTASDAFGNVATGFAGAVNLMSTDPNALFSPSSFTFTAADAGTHSFSATLKTAGPQSIEASNATNNLSGSEAGITVQPAAAHSFKLSGIPTSPTAGTEFSFTVTAYDAYGNVATGYAGTVDLSSSDLQAVFSPSSFTYTDADAGTHFFATTLKKAATQSITAKDANQSSISGVQSGIVVNAAPASALVISGFPGTTAGASHSFTVTAMDPFGNVATGYTGTIRFQSSDGQAIAGAGLPFDYTFETGLGEDNGVHVFNAVLKTAGTQFIRAEDTANSTIADTLTGIVVSAAAAARLVFGQQPTDGTAGIAIAPAPSVLVEDAYGNVVTGDSSTVTLTLSAGTFEGGSKSLTANVSAGVAKFNGLTIDLAGIRSFSAADGSLAPSGSSDSFTISPAAPARLVFHSQPSATAIAGQGFGAQPQVYEEDEFGNLETSDNTTVVAVSSGAGEGPLQGLTGVTVSGGIATFTNLSENAAGPISLTAKIGTLVPAISSSIDVMAAAATQLLITTPPPALLASGQSFTLVVAAKDPFGNVDPAFNGNVTVSIPDNPAFMTTVAARNGVATFVGLTLDQSASGQSIRASANGLSAAVTGPVQMPQPPTIIGEHIVTVQKTNKKGKKVGKPVLRGFSLDYSEPMSPSAGLAANYHVAVAIKKRVKRKTLTTLKPVPISAAYDAATRTVTLTVKGKPNFTMGGQILVTASSPGGVTSLDGEPLSSNDTKFVISPRAKQVQGPVQQVEPAK